MDRNTEAAEIIRRATSSREVKFILQGLQKRHDERFPKSGRIKLPFCMDMALAAKDDLEQVAYSSSNSTTLPMRLLEASRVFVCMAVGIMFMLRKSEHFGSRDKAQIRRRGFTFFDECDRVIPYRLIGIRRARRVAINVQFSKTDASGLGRRTQHSRQPGINAACIVQILEHWLCRTRDQYGAREDDALYFVPNLSEFKLDSLHRAMAATAHRMGLHSDALAPTSHSLRYGGATMMAAAGFPQYLIAQYGGWSEKSSSLKIYTKASAAMIHEVSKHMTEMSKLNVSKMFLVDASIRHQGQVRT
jgi:hypothetical protein